MLAAGADIARRRRREHPPGSFAEVVPPEVEQSRILRVDPRELAGDGAMVSVDTRNAATMVAALAAGARIVNDISALRHDPARCRPLLAGA